MRLTKIYWRRFVSPVSMAANLLVGATFALVFNADAIEQNIVHCELQKHQNDSKANMVDSHSASSS